MLDPFSSPDPTILLACGWDRELWFGPTPEVRDSRTSSKSDWLTIRNEFSAYAQKIGSDRSSRSQPQTRRIVGSGDENVLDRAPRGRSPRTRKLPPCVFHLAKWAPEAVMILLAASRKFLVRKNFRYFIWFELIK